ncbi:MAG: hypothetical protein P5702_23805 [Limnospira sp. PMC 1291.21]|uniref:hypothetical protein n=1 Tax=Limnospira TaxID=2596745 RepID=UPI001449D4D4|nr:MULTISPECIES: hypothetical protein [unclassified Limnospira]QJB29073.1 hypothetical protein HFV01_28780 [Limnospira fusiformis SAG 85.79]MDT9180596.1 hypothetical protein [Limnospira sp. PMC 1238.20]MDT9195921.1 hypothetical protein [Limnospira sp. PMC 1245.20]MDT9206165.1 hypothetical protein [Limnospira sp. PMC 1243.20]MDT9211317.1 hypothetical protein [Limnospira sp. PMC 1252.20]
MSNLWEMRSPYLSTHLLENGNLGNFLATYLLQLAVGDAIALPLKPANSPTQRSLKTSQPDGMRSPKYSQGNRNPPSVNNIRTGKMIF